MLTSEQWKRNTLAILFAGAIGFLVWIMNLRFAAGDVFPEYSSHRTDPKGCKALFEGLDAIESVNLQRNYRPLKQVRATSDTTLILLGLSPGRVTEMVNDNEGWLDSFLNAGGRLVLGMTPYAEPPFLWQPESAENSVPEQSPTGETRDVGHGDKEVRETQENELEECDPDSDTEPSDWFFQTQFGPEKPKSKPKFTPLSAQLQVDLPLPAELPWRSGFFFDALSNGWQTIYRTENGPTCMVFNRGPGSLVVLSDSFFFSNESLWETKQTALIIWLIGDRKQIIFDESHLGVISQTSISNLIFRYHFQGIVAGFLLLAILFFWRSTSPLVPHETPGVNTEPSKGKDAFSGRVNILKRSIASESILDVCFKEWEKTINKGPGTGVQEQIRSLVQQELTLDPKNRNTELLYRAIQQARTSRRNL